MIDWRKFVTAEFWSKKEISYQYVHFTNALFITYLMLMICDISILYVAGLLTGCLVELKQWIGGNHKVEDMIRDIIFWALGNGAGVYFFIS